MAIEHGYCHCGCGQRTPLAKKTRNPIGHKKGKPLSYVNGHNGRRSPVDYIEDPDTGCWVWQHRLTRSGYGMTERGGRASPAHRYFYEQARGPILDGLHLDHLCRNRACVNPDHLEPVTNAENQRRGDNAKLTPEDVAAIRATRPKQRFYGRRELAEQFGVHEATIQRVRNGRAWVGP